MIFKAFVSSTAKSIAVLRYLDENISSVNKLGAGVQIEKIGSDEMDEELMELFRKKGITRLPALLAPDGKVFIGIEQITAVFERNLNAAKKSQRLEPSAWGGQGGSETGMSTDISDFYMREMYAGYDKHGKAIPRVDKDEREDEGADIDKRLMEYRQNEPKHRRIHNPRERDIDPAPRARRDVRREEDNVADSDHDEPSPPPPVTATRSRRRAPTMAPTEDRAGDVMDQRILAAWMDKAPAAEDY